MEDPPSSREHDATPSQSSPEIRVNGPRRTRIREDLDRFLKDAKLSRRDFAEVLNKESGLKTNEAAIRRFLNPQASTVGNSVVLAIEAYLDKHVRPVWTKDDALLQPPPVASLFEVARAFFGMGPHKVRQYHRSVPGIYRFYAYSESDRGTQAVCIGAIRFGEDFRVNELQTSVADTGRTITEEFEGHYFYRAESLVAMLRLKEGHKPKFYVLAIPPYDSTDRRRQTLTGALLKIGAGRPVFTTTIHLVRREEAFKETDVVERGKVDESILKSLDSQQWFPR